MKNATYAVAGVSGHTGSVVAETLLAQGKQVRVIVRDAAKGAAWKAKGAEVAIAALGDLAAVTQALTGVAGAYLLLPPDVTSTTPIEHNAKLSATLAAAVRAAKVPHVVFLSSVGAQHATGNGPIKALHQGELDLAATGTALTAVRAAYFQENWGAALGMLAQGILPTFIPSDVRYPQVATKDIGKTIAAALVEGGTPGKPQIIELSGPRDYTGSEIAATLATLTGKPVAVQNAPLDAVVPMFTSFGLSAPVAELFREMYAGIASGRVAPEGGTARQVRGSTEVAETLKALLPA
ncbi:MAG: NmrA family NAD(P)-binding protein [Myxococcales bacterium]|nr:NmrA family NAD(P)-binding protein [Myxococcales bacterium]